MITGYTPPAMFKIPRSFHSRASSVDTSVWYPDSVPFARGRRMRDEYTTSPPVNGSRAGHILPHLPAIGSHAGYIPPPLLRSVLALGIYYFPSCDWFSRWVYTASPPVIGQLTAPRSCPRPWFQSSSSLGGPGGPGGAGTSLSTAAHLLARASSVPPSPTVCPATATGTFTASAGEPMASPKRNCSKQPPRGEQVEKATETFRARPSTASPSGTCRNNSCIY
eukprot:1180450-Prorocentrum_minimum.AAC.9